MLQKQADYWPRRINQYVPAAKYHSQVENGIYRISFGAPLVADVDFIATAVVLTTGVAKTFTLANDDLLSAGSLAPYGRNVTATASIATTRLITVTGTDYMGQKITETFSLAGASTVSGKKAFAYIDSVTAAAEANIPSVSIGFGDVLGLPFKTVKDLSEEADGAEATLGTLVAGVVTDPQTATTGDPRGTYDPNTTLDGTTVITATFMAANDVNSSGNGGLYGIAHYSA